MRIALIADTFPPLRTSGAVQLRDLSREFVRQGHHVTVMLPADDLNSPWQLEDYGGVQVLRLQAPRTKGVGYMRRTLAELLMPFAMKRNLQKSPLAAQKWDGVVWYSPSIFHGPLTNFLKRRNGCKSYLILRDIFPQWALDMGLMRRGLPYLFFAKVAEYQYSVADIIGVQTPGNLVYFNSWKQKPQRQLEVLQNWLAKPDILPRCTIRIDETPLIGRRIFVYAGNLGVAQGMDIILDLAAKFLPRDDVGFLFVGRGSEVVRLRAAANKRGLTNLVFFDEIHPDEISDLYAQCDVGLVALDSRHKSHNIPGKFLTYIQNGLPVLANVNSGNDLAPLIREEGVGQVCETNNLEELYSLAQKLLDQASQAERVAGQCRALFDRQFSAAQAAEQIVTSLSAQE